MPKKQIEAKKFVVTTFDICSKVEHYNIPEEIGVLRSDVNGQFWIRFGDCTMKFFQVRVTISTKEKMTRLYDLFRKWGISKEDIFNVKDETKEKKPKISRTST